MPQLTGHLQPRINWSTLAFSILITHLILRIWPHQDYHLFLGLKYQLKGLNFSSDKDVIAAVETWLDGERSEFFVSGLQKLEQRTKKCIELLGEYVE
jgi:hypothetical protein